MFTRLLLLILTYIVATSTQAGVLAQRDGVRLTYQISSIPWKDTNGKLSPPRCELVDDLDKSKYAHLAGQPLKLFKLTARLINNSGCDLTFQSNPTYKLEVKGFEHFHICKFWPHEKSPTLPSGTILDNRGGGQTDVWTDLIPMEMSAGKRIKTESYAVYIGSETPILTTWSLSRFWKNGPGCRADVPEQRAAAQYVSRFSNRDIVNEGFSSQVSKPFKGYAEGKTTAKKQQPATAIKMNTAPHKGVTGLLAKKSLESESIIGKTFQWHKKDKGKDYYRERTFFEKGQFAEHIWQSVNGHVNNPVLSRGSWKVKGDKVHMEFEIPGRKYGKQWVYLQWVYSLKGQELSFEELFINDTEKVLESNKKSHYIDKYKEVSPAGIKVFRKYFNEGYNKKSYQNRKKEWNLKEFKSEVIDKYPFKWIGIGKEPLI